MNAVSQVLTAGELGAFRGGSGFPVRYQGKKSGDLPFFKVSDMNSEGNELFMTRANNYVSEARRKALGAARIPKRAIVFAKVGAAVFRERKRILAQDSCIDNNMAAFIVDERKLDVRFAYYLLAAFRMSELVAVGALPSLNGGQLRSIPLLVPNDLAEQKRIAAALVGADDLIAGLEMMIAKKQAIKQGMMQELLLGRRRLFGFSGGWVQTTAGQIGAFKGGTGFPVRYQGAASGKYPFYKVSDMNLADNERVMRAANNYISEPQRKQIGAVVLPRHAIVFAKVGAAIFQERKRLLDQPSCIDNNMGALILDAESADPHFVRYALTNFSMGTLVATSALPSLNTGQLRSIPLSLPPTVDEQRAIASALLDVDAELDALSRRMTKARAIKQGMMQQLLTGRVRFPAEDAV